MYSSRPKLLDDPRRWGGGDSSRFNVEITSDGNSASCDGGFRPEAAKIGTGKRRPSIPMMFHDGGLPDVHTRTVRTLSTFGRRRRGAVVVLGGIVGAGARMRGNSVPWAVCGIRLIRDPSGKGNPPAREHLEGAESARGPAVFHLHDWGLRAAIDGARKAPSYRQGEKQRIAPYRGRFIAAELIFAPALIAAKWIGQCAWAGAVHIYMGGGHA